MTNLLISREKVYEQLSEFLDVYPPEVFIEKIHSLIHFANRSSLEEMQGLKPLGIVSEYLEHLVRLKDSFEDSVASDDSWSIYLFHRKKRIMINLSRIDEFIDADTTFLVMIKEVRREIYHQILEVHNIEECKEHLMFLDHLIDLFE